MVTTTGVSNKIEIERIEFNQQKAQSEADICFTQRIAHAIVILIVGALCLAVKTHVG